MRAAVLEVVREAALDLRRRGPASMPPPWRLFAPVDFVTAYLAAAATKYKLPSGREAQAGLVELVDDPFPIEMVPVAGARRAYLQFVSRESRWGLQTEVPTELFCAACCRGWGPVDHRPLERKCLACGSEQVSAVTWDFATSVKLERLSRRIEEEVASAVGAATSEYKAAHPTGAR